MKQCKNSRNCQYGNAMTPGYCAYDEDMEPDRVCPILIDAWDRAPDDMNIIKRIGNADGKN